MPFRFDRLVVTGCALVALAVGAGCEKAHSVPPEDQQLALGQSAAAYCPSINTKFPTTVTDQYASRSRITATVYAKDGEVAPGQRVRFDDVTGASGVQFLDANYAPITDNTVETDSTGRASAYVITTEASRNNDGHGRLVTTDKTAYYQAKVQATLLSNNTVSQPMTLITPPMPTVYWAYTTSAVKDATVTVVLGASSICNAAKVAGTLRWNTTYLQLTGISRASGSPLDTDQSVDSDGTTITYHTTLTPETIPTDNPGVLDFSYERKGLDSSTPPFVSGDGTSWGAGSGIYLNFTFKALAVTQTGTPAQLEMTSLAAFAASANGNSPIGIPYVLQTFNVTGPTGVTITAPTSRSRYGTYYPRVQPRAR